MRLKFTTPFPPSANTAYPTCKVTGRRYTSPKVKIFKEEVALLIRSYYQAFDKSDRLHVTFKMHPPDKRKRDVANFEKVLVDCFSGFIFPDDEQIDHFEIKRGPVAKGGFMGVTIEVME